MFDPLGAELVKKTSRTISVSGPSLLISGHAQVEIAISLRAIAKMYFTDNPAVKLAKNNYDVIIVATCWNCSRLSEWIFKTFGLVWEMKGWKYRQNWRIICLQYQSAQLATLKFSHKQKNLGVLDANITSETKAFIIEDSLPLADKDRLQ